MIHLDGGEPQTLESLDSPGLADEARERVTGLTIAVTAEIDARQDDLPVALRDPATDLREDCGGGRLLLEPLTCGTM